jgi:hypothetical protein
LHSALLLMRSTFKIPAFNIMLAGAARGKVVVEV